MIQIIQGFLFDLDGTIWDSRKAIIETLSDINEKYGGKLNLETFAKNSSDAGWPLKLLKKYGVDLNLYWKSLRNHYSSVSLYFENTKDIFRKLLKCGKKIGTVTSLKKEVAIGLLEKFELSKYFSVRITPSEIHAKKPSSAPIIEAINRLGLKKFEVIYIGDQDVDIIAAKKAGCYFGFAGWTQTETVTEKPDYVFFNLEDLLHF